MNFFYRAKKGPDEIRDGHIEATDYRTAVEKLLRLGFTPIEVKPVNEMIKKDRPSGRTLFSAWDSFREKIFQTDAVLLTRYLADFLQAGVPVLQSLQLSRQYFSGRRMFDVLQETVRAVEGGESLSAAMGRFPAVFSDVYINMIYAGEMSGTLEETVSRLADFLERDQETRMKVLSSLIYPCLIVAAGCATLFVLFTWVIPRITVIFNEMDQALPVMTQVLMAISDFFAKFWWLLIAVILAGSFIFIRWYESKDGKMAVHKKLLNVFGLGRFIRQVALARFARTLGTLLNGGVDLVPALGYASRIVNNCYLYDQLGRIVEDVSSGSSLNRAVKECSLFLEADVHMISVGEQTGSLAESFLKLAAFYEKSNDRIMKTITTLIEPVFILILGVIICLVVLAMVMPIFQMNLVIH